MLPKHLLAIGILCLWLMACTPSQTATTPPPLRPTVPATPTALITCATVDAAWGNDWAAAISALETLTANGLTCGAEALAVKQYAAHFSYAAALEAQGDTQAARHHYEAAYALEPTRLEALNALAALGYLPEPTPTLCLNPSPPTDPAPLEAATPSDFLTVRGNAFALHDEPFIMRGVNYYPRHAAWADFLPNATAEDMAQELTWIQAAGFNTIRIFLQYDALFTCAPEMAMPKADAFATLDTLLSLAQERNLRVIVTLNDLPDLLFRPLYTDWERYDAQTVYIVRRYRNNPTIAAWDLRNEGDLDYGARTGDTPKFSEAEVLAWLTHSAGVVREHDPHHLITAGWWGDPTATEAVVDFLSFHHWANADELQTRLTIYQANTDKPLVLQEVGYHSWADAPTDARTEVQQAALLAEVTTVTEANGLAGWLVWSAFDFTPRAGQPPTYEHHFGLWRTDGTPKPALDLLQRLTTPERSQNLP